MRIKKIHVSKLNPYANNARLHSDSQVNQIAASITEFGFMNPVLVDGKNTIIAGHGRVMAAKKLGLKEVPCIVSDHLTEDQIRAYVIADNQLALNATWDEEMLSSEVVELKELEFDVELLGFSDEEMTTLQEIAKPAPEYDESKQDDVPEVEENIHGVKRGDIYLFDPYFECDKGHRVEYSKDIKEGDSCPRCG